MLPTKTPHPTLPAKDIDRAKKFYQGLGFEIIKETPAGVFFKSGDTRFLVFPTPSAGTAQNTAMGWEVDDIEATVKELAGKGVKFEQYANEYLKTDEMGIATRQEVKSAWFKDSEGNTLGIVQIH